MTTSWTSRIFLLLFLRAPGFYGTHRFAELCHQISARHSWSRRHIYPKQYLSQTVYLLFLLFISNYPIDNLNPLFWVNRYCKQIMCRTLNNQGNDVFCYDFFLNYISEETLFWKTFCLPTQCFATNEMMFTYTNYRQRKNFATNDFLGQSLFFISRCLF